MKKLIFCWMLFISSVISAQTSSVGFMNIRYGNEREFKSTDHLFHTIGTQFGSMITDEWGLEIDYVKGLGEEYNFDRIGVNTIYQFINMDPNVTPFVKLGVAHKSYKYNDVDDHGCDVKIGAGINIPIYASISLNLGINVSNCIYCEGKNGWDNTVFEIEAGICFLLY